MVQIQEATRFDLLVHTLKAAARDHGPAGFSTSLSAEDSVITDVILAHGIDIDIFMVTTRPLHKGELDELARIRSRYGREVRIYTPHAESASQNDALYGSGIADPLRRALHGKNAWITGLRQAVTARHTVTPYEYDAERGVLRFNPLVEWSESDVRDYLDANKIACPVPETALAA
jgi:phosphoadenosine phosphosulfate reductase